MANRPLSGVIDQLRKTAQRADQSPPTDGQLLRRYIQTREDAAFEALVRLHGPMVLGACRRLLDHVQDAEDAFQATFLVLARKAASVAPPEAVGSWLYGVAYNTALKARAASVRRRAKEKQVTAMPDLVAAEDVWPDLAPLLDSELNRLPDKYRLPVILCDLEGRSRRAVARDLKIPEGTLSSRLTTARKMLARGLRRRGLPLAEAALATTIWGHAKAAGLPTSLVAATVKAAGLFTSGAATATFAPAAALAEGVLKGMVVSKLKLAAALLLSVGGLAALAGGHVARAVVADGPREQRPDGPPQHAHPGQHAHGDNGIKGSGTAATKDLKIKDFNAVEVRGVFHVEIVRAESFGVTVTADDNLLPHVRVTQDGSTLRIAMDADLKSFWATSLKATVTMPELERVGVSGPARVTCKGFNSEKTFTAKLSEGGNLDGQIRVRRIALDLADVARATLKGSGTDLHILASRSCTLALRELAADRADVTLKEACSATVQVKGKLDYDLTDSRLDCWGSPAIGKQETSGSATVHIMTGVENNENKPGLAFPHDPAAFQKHLREQHEHLRQMHARMGLPDPFPGFVHVAPAHQRPADAAQPARVSVGDQVPDFALIGLDGKAVTLSALQKGARAEKKVVVLSFWCSFCPSCRRVERALDQLAKDYSGRAIVAALDASWGETAEKATAAIKKAGLTLPVVFDPDGKTADLFGTTVTTTTVVIDADGVLRYCGRFNEPGHAYAEYALKAVLAGQEVAVKTTRHDGCGIVRKPPTAQ
jgi:RNA polymerase sigma factor (sigma-70 family)